MLINARGLHRRMTGRDRAPGLRTSGRKATIPNIIYKPCDFHGIEITRCKYPLAKETQPIGRVERIYVHNTFSHTTPERILALHRERGFAGIGYHFVIDRDGRTFYTRPISVAGAHMYGHNRTSIGVVFIDIDACASSVPAYRAWRKLHEAINRAHRKELPAYTHTKGQFDYLFSEIDKHIVTQDADTRGTTGIVPATMDEMISTHHAVNIAVEPRMFAILQAQAQMRVEGVYEEKARLRFSGLARALKRCPETDVRTLSRIL